MRAPQLRAPGLEEIGEVRCRSPVLDEVCVVLGNLEELGDEVGDVLPLEQVGIELRGVDLKYGRA